MIPFDFRYLRAESAEEAVAAWSEARDRGETAHYYGGGTEIVTLARESKLHTDCVIDYKRIPEATAIGATTDEDGTEWIAIGAAVSLNALVDRVHPLVSWCCRGVADRTVRNSITLGGNICGMLPYRETVVPWLLMEGAVETISPAGRRLRSVEEIFDKRLKLESGELALRFLLPVAYVADEVRSEPERYRVPDAVSAYGPRVASGEFTTRGAQVADIWFYERRTKEARTDYPLVTLAMLVHRSDLRVALSGAWGYPARARSVEDAIVEAGGIREVGERLSDTPSTVHARIATALDAEARAFRNDQRASADYRRELTVQAILRGIERIAARNGGAR